jgi:hypothetical protein
MPERTPAAAPAGRAWIVAALLAGVSYLVIGRVFALPTSHVRVWRLAAWLVSGVVYAAHIAYEHFERRDAPRAAALRVALGVALGAFALAVAGMLHARASAPGVRPTWLLALVMWPAVTALPAYLGARVAVAILSRLPRRADAS